MLVFKLRHFKLAFVIYESILNNREFIEHIILKIEHFNNKIDHTCINHINLDIIFFVFTINHHHLFITNRQICKQRVINYISLNTIILHTLFIILPSILSTYLLMFVMLFSCRIHSLNLPL